MAFIGVCLAVISVGTCRFVPLVRLLYADRRELRERLFRLFERR